jgi:soluble lytic murein transglycosylase-like protein
MMRCAGLSTVFMLVALCEGPSAQADASSPADQSVGPKSPAATPVQPATTDKAHRQPPWDQCATRASRSANARQAKRYCDTRRYLPAFEQDAAKNELPVEFFARVIWQESRFNARAVSPEGAPSIAQFISQTANFRGLGDPFDALEALKNSEEFGKLSA